MEYSNVITRWLIPSRMTNTEYGEITNMDWLLKEQARISEGTGRNVVIETNDVLRKRLVYGV